jgi:transcription elongation GreA/GreB family factor
VAVAGRAPAPNKKLVEVDLPKNSHDIAVARSYGDLRENFEYQAAKDLQRQLLQRQAEMQIELKTVKGTDFADAPCNKVGSGTTVVLRRPTAATVRTPFWEVGQRRRAQHHFPTRPASPSA